MITLYATWLLKEKHILLEDYMSMNELEKHKLKKEYGRINRRMMNLYSTWLLQEKGYLISDYITLSEEDKLTLRKEYMNEYFGTEK
jgi:hypothetical protein